VAELLKKAGYVCGGFGKWGLGTVGTEGVPEKQGFDVFFGYYHQVHAHSYYTSHLFRNSVRVPLPGNEKNRRRQYSHNEIYREAVAFIRDNAEKPFFCYLPWTPPHAKYEFPRDDPVWDWYNDKPWNQPAKVAAAMDSLMDRQIGEITALLKELGIYENTIMFFCSDNGAAKRFDGIHNSSGEMQGFKRSMHEGGIRVPFIVRWPGRIKPGTVSVLPVYFPDVMPTLAELAGIEKDLPEEIDGLSIVPTLLGKGKQKRHEYLFWEHGGTRAVRSGKWKGILKKGKPIAVYDLSNDIGERNDLARDHPDIAKRLSRYIREAWTEPRNQKEPRRVKNKKK
jgi:arylsulfatase A-like enzyme